MKSIRDPQVLHLLLRVVPILVTSAGAEQVTALAGTNVTFTAILSSPHTELNWYQGDSKIVEVEQGRAPDFYRQWGQRVIVDLHKATLILRNVTPADSGAYRAEPLYYGQLLTPVSFNLQVLDGSRGMIIGCSVAAVVLVIGVLVGLWICKRKNPKYRKMETEEWIYQVLIMSAGMGTGVIIISITIIIGIILYRRTSEMMMKKESIDHLLIIGLMAPIVIFFSLKICFSLQRKKGRFCSGFSCKKDPRDPEKNAENADESLQGKNADVADLEESANENTPLNVIGAADSKDDGSELQTVVVPLQETRS